MLPQGWAEATVDDLGEYLNGMAFKPTDWGDEGIGIIRIQNLTAPAKPLNRTKRQFDERYRVRKGDLLVSWSATLDAFIWDREDAVLNQHIFKVTPSACVDSRFLFFQLRELIAEMAASEHLHGSTMKHINRGPFLAHAAALPPLAEQRRIVAKLDALTARLARARAELDRVPVLAKRLRANALRTAFSPAVASADLDGNPDPAIDGRTLPVYPLAADWEWRAVGSVATVSGGLTKNAARATLQTRVPYLRVANVYANALRLDDVAAIGCTPAELAKTRVEPGDILVVEGNGSLDQVGRAAMWCGEIDGCSHQNHLIRVRAGEGVLPEFVLWWMLSPEGRSRIERLAASTSGLHTLSISKISGLPIPVPSVSVQEVVVASIKAVFARADRLEAEATRARALLDRLESALLAKAFRGELVPQDPNDEPAQTLLDRIRTQRAAAPKAKRGRKAKVAA